MWVLSKTLLRGGLLSGSAQIKDNPISKMMRIFKIIFCSQYSVKANLMKRKISPFLGEEHKYLFQTIL